MSRATDEELADFDDRRTNLWNHLSSFEFADWIDVSDEARRVCNVAFKSEIEAGSPMDDVISATAAEGWMACIRNFAKIMGIDPEELSAVISEAIDEGEELDLATLIAMRKTQ